MTSATPLRSNERVRAKLLAALMFLAFASLFISLRSKDMFGVDGAFRCLEVFRRNHLFFHPNNHMLYPANVLLWTRATGALGIKPQTREGFFANTQIMNCVAGAGCLAIFFYLVYRTTLSLWLSLVASASLGISGAFFLHATNSAEVMVGVFWSFLAIGSAATAARSKSQLPIICSALFFSLAMASYQSTIFLAPAAIVLIWYARSKTRGESGFSRDDLRDAGLFIASGVVCCAVIFGWAYWLQGFRSPSQMFTHFFQHADARPYFGVSAKKLLVVPIALVRNTFAVVPGFMGFRYFLHQSKPALILFASLSIVYVAVLAGSIAAISRSWKSLSISTQAAVLAASTGLVFTLIPVAIWTPDYDKLWLQPLACLFFLVAAGVHSTKFSRGSASARARVIASTALAALLFNFVPVTHAHLTRNRDLEETEQLVTVIGPRDLLVGDWDRISNLYEYGWSRDEQFISFPAQAVERGADSVRVLDEAVRKTQASGGRVYFLGILDKPRESWDVFLGARCGVAYSSLEKYRTNSPVETVFESNPAEIILRRLNSGR